MASDEVAADILAPFPRARWRLATDALGDVVLFPSHIVIRYRGTDEGTGVQRYPGWQPNAEATRTRAQARSLALRLEAQLRADPTRFAELAAQHSDDAVTRDLGGDLGALAAIELNAGYLDAMAATKPGQISRAFETGYGFHIIRHNPPPAEQLVAGERLVIAYRTASPRFLATPERSRAQALDMARRLVEIARQDPESFSKLVDQHSDALGTDLSRSTGVWSTRERGPAALPIAVLSRIKEGEISEPVDTVHGFQILRRIPATVDTRFAFQAVRLSTPAMVPADQRADAQRRIAEVEKTLTADATRFDMLRLQHCCMPVEQFTSSKMYPAVERALQALAVGAVGSSPVYTELEVFFLRRLDPALQEPAAPATFELPDSPANVDKLVVEGESKAIARSLRTLIDSASLALGLDTRDATAIRKVCERLAVVVETAPPGARRKAELSRTKADLAKILGESGYEKYMAFAKQWAADELLQNNVLAAATQGTTK